MTDCALCKQLETKRGLVYEDADVVALLSATPAAAGHVIVAPKQHHVILEQVPEGIVSKLFTLANRFSIALFEVLGVHGTNILVPNGLPAGQMVPHAAVHVVPRIENDGIDINWKPITPDADAMSTAELMIKDALIVKEEKPVEKKKETPKMSDEENYLIRALKRIP
jgi:histidine triad (HIT) family protein